MFTIGEFSKFCCISARMLRHYDRIGLLCPEKTDESNGYRYYSSGQLEEFHRIEKLKQYGFSLAEIRQLLPLSGPEQNVRIALQYERLKVQMADLKKTLSRMEADLSLHKEESVMDQNYHVIVMNNPAQNVFTVRRTVAVCGEEIHRLITDLLSEAEKRGLNRSGPIQLAYFNEEFNEEQMDLEAQLAVAQSNPETRLLPESLCVATIHKGPMESIHHAYNAVCRYLEEHPEYRMTGPSLERFLKDETMVSSEDELETAVMFPVRLASGDEAL